MAISNVLNYTKFILQLMFSVSKTVKIGHGPKWLWVEMTSDRLDIFDLRRTSITKKGD